MQSLGIHEDIGRVKESLDFCGVLNDGHFVVVYKFQLESVLREMYHVGCHVMTNRMDRAHMYCCPSEEEGRLLKMPGGHRFYPGIDFVCVGVAFEVDGDQLWQGGK